MIGWFTYEESRLRESQYGKANQRKDGRSCAAKPGRKSQHTHTQCCQIGRVPAQLGYFKKYCAEKIALGGHVKFGLVLNMSAGFFCPRRVHNIKPDMSGFLQCWEPGTEAMFLSTAQRSHPV